MAKEISDTVIKQFQGEYRWLSNFWLCEIEFDEITYPSVENAYQANKSDNFEDKLKFVRVTPGQAKRLGRTLNIRKDWEVVKLPLMKVLNEIKFQHEDLKQKLLATGTAQIQEGNSWGDCYWGVDLATNSGANHLGEILMEIRARLAQW